MESPIPLNWAQSVANFAALCQKNGLDPLKITQPSDLSDAALDPAYNRLVLACFEPIYLQIVCQWLQPGAKIDQVVVLTSICSVAGAYPLVLSLIEHFFLVHPQILDAPEPVLKPVYQLLSYYRARFIAYIKPAPLYALISSPNKSTRALAILVLGLYMGVAESLVDQWLEKFCGSVAPEIRLLPLELAKRNSEFQLLDQKEGSGMDLELSPLLVNIAGLLLPKFSLAPSGTTDFIPTPTSLANVRRIAQALLVNKPVLLKGGPGSGKTFYVESLATKLRPDSDITRIHLGEQTDSKALIGTYSTGEKPGTFEWKQGVLTAAVVQGKWVLIEDLDKAPTDVISTLLPLLEKREWLIPSRNEIITAHPGFQLFATISTTKRNHDIIGQRLWDQITIQSPAESDLVLIIRSAHPNLDRLAEQFVQVYLTLAEIYEKKSHTRPISTRDLFKWCQRSSRILDLSGRQRQGSEGDEPEFFATEVYDDIYREAVRCFTAFSDNKEFTMSIAEIIGDCLDIGSSKVGPLLTHYIPRISETEETVRIGCAELSKRPVSAMLSRKFAAKCQSFAMTSHGVRLLEQIAVATSGSEPILLSGETGTGKTTVVQHLANMTNRKIVVINISQQMEASDLVGGFKPVDVKMIAGGLLEEFDDLFDSTFSRTKNQQFCSVLAKAVSKNSWKNVVKLWKEAYKMVTNLASQVSTEESNPPTKKRRLESVNMHAWGEFLEKVAVFEVRAQELQNSIIFQFIEGLLIKATRRGDWVLLDEINLAPADTLEGIADLLNQPPSLTLLEKGGDEVVKAHPDFRLFACMNPATDFGKKDLPEGIRSRFTEIYVRSPDENIEDLRFIIDKYIGRQRMNDTLVVNDIAQLFLEAKRLSADHSLVDGAGQRPHFSIRTLSRTLAYASSIAGIYSLRRALFEGFCMSFLTLLDKASISILQPLIEQHILGRVGNVKSLLASIPPAPDTDHDYLQFKHYWIRKGEHECFDDPKYIITPSVETNLLNLVRATATKNYPVLIQGPTSSGKTSMIKYLASKTGHKFVRINNHEHTDIQEYLGTYVTDKNGVLVFQEGVLVEAVRNGYWIVLDELNLAPTDVLEALNRLLDDNREILIPETQEVVRPHPDFMLFATQNPPGVYAGRKILSRAFRNRFLELHFDDIPQDELELILKDRCQIAPTYAKKIVDVYKDLAGQRQLTRVFEQKNSFATLRDLFRWALREAVGYEQLAFNGYLLLGERVRSPSEKLIVKNSIEKVMKVKIDVDYESMAPTKITESAGQVVWTKAMKRLLVLVLAALEQNEPILLVGETGCGKTTICQLLSEVYGIPLNIVNAHQNTETGDLIGSQRPVRNRAEVSQQLSALFAAKYPHQGLVEAREAYRAQETADPEIDALLAKSDALFEWVDGPLVSSMKQGSYFLLDEISLADDSVLERLNSVLEPERSLLLPEKGSEDIFVVGQPGFQLFATMNPGGDYGKKELSPALRNRFTEIWVPSMEDFDDVALIVESKLVQKEYTNVITEFSRQFALAFGHGVATSGIISLRDILNWVQFANSSTHLEPSLSVFHGGCMVFIDSIGSNALSHLANSPEVLKKSRAKMVAMLCDVLQNDYNAEYFKVPRAEINDDKVDFGPFFLERIQSQAGEPFSLQAPTTALNAMRVVRSMVIDKPILLEGSPGVGKTSLVSAIANITGHKLTRINLSDQTDLADLFGSDAPKEGSKAGEFTWRDAPFLRALQQGDWVLLDEMNLAPQQVLEGLNACLDHRGEAYIPELDRSFKRHPNFRVFAAQNPQAQGGGRKGLPKSFVNRFSVVYMDSLALADLELITEHLYPEISLEIRQPLVRLIEDLNNAVGRSLGLLGQPFEFNLRDTMRWFSLCQSYGMKPVEFFDLVVVSRFRTESDRALAWEMYHKYFDDFTETKQFNISSQEVIAGHSTILQRVSDLARIHNPLNGHLQCNTMLLETSITCIEKNWPLILVGPTLSGKTSFLRYLAFLYGAQLKEFSMSADIDSTDLLGGFDQVERGQQLASIWSRIEDHIEMSLDSGNIALLEAARNRNLEHAKSLLRGYPELIELIETYEATDFNVPKFKWIDGVLVRAIENGHWLTLDNANLCNPSVLDRLNSLLELNGSLSINECAEADGEPRQVKPHPNFRLFMTVDPKYGELSRAMRNRGVEVFVDSLQTRSTQFDKQTLGLEADVETESVSEADITSLSLFTPVPVASKLPVWNSNVHSSTLFADLTRKVNPHWTALLFLSAQNLPIVESVSKQHGDAFFEYLDQYSALIKLNERPLLPVDSSSLFETKAAVILHDLEAKLSAAVESAKTTPEGQMNLVELSILSRSKSSINVLDAYSFLYTALTTTKWSHELQGLQILAQFAQMLLSKDFDQSRVPVFRDLLQNYISSDAAKFINLHFDFSKGGMGLESLWAKVSSGFPNQEIWTMYNRLLHQIEAFDEVASECSASDKQQITSIRESLCMFISDLSRGDTTKSGLVDVLEKAVSALVPSERKSRHFKGAFGALKDRVRLNHWASPASSNLCVLANLEFYSGNNTLQLSQDYAASSSYMLPWLDPKNDFIGPIFNSVGSLGQVSGMVYHEAVDELEVIADIIDKQAHLLTDKNYLPLFERLKAELGYSESSTSFLAFAEALVEQNLPWCVFDPAIRQHVLYDNYRAFKRDADSDIAHWQATRALFVSDTETAVDLALQTKLRDLDVQPAPSIYRPRVSRINRIYAEISSIRTIIEPQFYRELSSEQLDIWNSNLQKVVDRLSSYTDYKDLVEVFKGVLLTLKLAVNLEHHKQGGSNLWLLNPVKTTLDASKLSSLYFKSSMELAPVQIYILRCAQYYNYKDIQGVCDHIFESLYQSWTAKRLQDQERAAAEAKDFRQGDEESQMEEDFRKLFPDYQGEVPATLSRGGSVNSDLCAAYFNLFGEASCEFNENLEHLVGAFNAIPCGEDSAAAFPALLMYLRSQIKKSKIIVGDEFNFYLEPSHVEAKNAIDFALAVRARIKELLERWPEHETLLTVYSCCREILEYAAATPIARYLQKIEQIHHYLDEWQKFASKDATVAPLIEKVTGLIVSWRRLELRTWPSLFEHEKRSTEAATCDFWFHLFETLIYNPSRYEGVADYSEIVRILVLFISGSTFGQYHTRTKLVRAFARHAAVAVPRVGECIRNVLDFYDQYSDSISKMISDKEKALAKEIKEVILLASWKDVNIASLKQSAHRSHRSLYKIVRKYRDFVNKPISEILSSEPASISLSAVSLQPFNVDSGRVLYEVEAISGLGARPKHLLNLPKRTEMMIDYCNQVYDATVPDLLDLATSTVEEAKRLGEETPAHLTEENKKEISALRVEKGRLLTETLKALKDAGLGTNIKADTIQDQSMISKVLSETINLPNSAYFYRIVELLPRLRSAAQASESDAPVSDLKRGMAFSENLVNLLLKQRQALGKHNGGGAAIEQLKNQLLDICDMNDEPVTVDGALSFKNLSIVLRYVASCGGAAAFQTAASELETLSGPTVTTKQWYSRVLECFEQIKSVSASGFTAAITTQLLEALEVPKLLTATTELSLLDEQFVKVSSSVLVIIQEALSISNEIDELADEKWLMKSVKLLKKLSQSLRVESMVREISAVIDSIKSCKDSRVARNLAQTFIPFIAIYAELVRVVDSKLETNLFNNTKSTYQLMKLLQNLATHGFCTPQEESHEEQDTSQMQSGTGLGDGEGAQTSKNDDDEEQQPDLDDISQQANKDQKQKDGSEEDQEDNAMEMEGDMAGELEDYENNESDADDDDKSDQEDIDDEVGDIDNLDPNAVDEKMWDDETNSKKEKETDENVNGEEGEMEAGNEDQDENQQDKPEQQDQEQQDNNDDGSEGESDAEAAQDDELQAGANEQLEENVEERDALDLPEDMQLDSGEENDAQDDDDDDNLEAQDEGLDVPEEQEQAQDQDQDQEQEATNEAGDSGEEDANLEGVNDDVDMDPKDEGEAESGEPEGDPEGEADEPKAEDGGEDNMDAMDVDTEGLHGPDQSEQVDEQQTTRSEQKSEMSGEGANQEVTQEQDAMDTGETAAASTTQNMEKQESDEQNRKENSETLKQLGDALKEFYDRQKDIQEKTERDDVAPDVEKDVNLNPDEVEHVGDADDFDAQALGKVTEDIKQEIDQDMAVEEDKDHDDNDDVAGEYDALDSALPEPHDGETGNDGSAPADAADDQEDPNKDSIVKAGGETKHEFSEDEDDMEVDQLLERTVAAPSAPRVISETHELWKTYDSKTHDLSLILCEQLRLILEPTLATKLRGDYKTGKRLNMKRIIPFIASNFKKDKIWLRRTKPSKREYQVLIAVDDSKSMGEPVVVDLAFQAIALVSNALTQVEAGDLAIAKFGQDTEVVHAFNTPFNAGAGANVLRYFNFDQERTDVCRLLSKSLEVFSTSSDEQWRLEIILSDGICEDHERLRKLVREAHEQRIMLVFVVLDALNKDGSILDMNQVNYTTDANGNMKLNVDRYMDQFPFEYYVIVRDIKELPHVMASVLRQYFQAVE